MKIKIYAVIITLLLIPPFAMASRGGGGGLSYEGQLFWGADLDRNFRLDRDEAKAIYNLSDDEIFTRYDKNNSGTINRAEFREFIQQSPWVKKFVHPKDEKEQTGRYVDGVWVSP